MRLSVPQAIHRAMTEALCCDLWDALESGSLEGGGTGSIRCRACVVLYLLLCDHPVDRQGRCRSCRHPGAVLGQRLRTCRIHTKASFWLRQPDDEDGPLVGNRVTGDWVDAIHIEGFSRDCFAWRKRTSSLIVPGEGLVERRVHGNALTVLNEVLTWQTADPLE